LNYGVGNQPVVLHDNGVKVPLKFGSNYQHPICS